MEKGTAAQQQWMQQQKERNYSNTFNNSNREEGVGSNAAGGCITVIRVDLDDPESMEETMQQIRAALRKSGGNDSTGLDVMIHNAAYITYSFSVAEVQQSIRTNYRGIVALTKALFQADLLKKNDSSWRMIFVSSAIAKTYLVQSSMAHRLLSPDLAESELDEHMNSLQRAVEQGTYKMPTNSMGGEAYGLGKLGGTTIYPRILARQFNKNKNVLITSCCPAFGGPDTPVWLTTAPMDVVAKGHGGFWEQRELTNALNWQAGMMTSFAQTGMYPVGHA
jgi:NAD(P)-dependent dehydrogenase (short-subunit alcohol dehydrogenase family)